MALSRAVTSSIEPSLILVSPVGTFAIIFFKEFLLSLWVDSMVDIVDWELSNGVDSDGNVI